MELEKEVLRRSYVLGHLDEFRNNGNKKVECAAYCLVSGCTNFTMGHLDLDNLIFESTPEKILLSEDLKYRCEKHRR